MAKKRNTSISIETSSAGSVASVPNETNRGDASLPTIDEDTLAAELLTHLTKLHRRATRGVVALSLVLAMAVTGWVIRDATVGNGGLLLASGVGLTGGVTFGAVFLTSFGILLSASRAWMRRKAETARNEAVYENKLGPDALLWVVGMFSPKGKGMGFEDEIRRGRGSRRAVED